MSDSCEPPAKKARSSTESESEAYDRVIIVGKKMFHVNSEYLASKSEYFRILFQSDFKEKDQKTIELNGTSSKSLEQFLLVIEKPEDFKATKAKLIDLLATITFFLATDALKTICENANILNKIPKKELLELAKTFALSKITKMVEDWYLARFEVSRWNSAAKLALYQQLQYAVEYGMERLETKIMDFITRKSSYLPGLLDKIINDQSELGRKVYEKFKTLVFEVAASTTDRTMVFDVFDRTYVLGDFTLPMNESQFEDVKNQVENMILKRIETENKDILMCMRLVQPCHIKKMEKLKALATTRFIADFPRTHDWRIIDAAIYYNLDALKAFLQDYLRNNYTSLREEVKERMSVPWGDVNKFIRDATQCYICID